VNVGTPPEQRRPRVLDPGEREEGDSRTSFELHQDLKGSQHWIKMTKGDLDTAEAYFDIALRKDPGYAAAYAGLAWVWVCRNQLGFAPPSEGAPRTREFALKALSLDETLAGLFLALAAPSRRHGRAQAKLHPIPAPRDGG
jgi:hypothetical protein